MTPPTDDTSRAQMLSELRRMGTAREEQFDTLVRLAARHLECPIAWLAVLGENDDPWLKAETGLEARALPRSAHGMAEHLPAIDAVTLELNGPSVSTAAACRVRVRHQCVGVLCVMDTGTRAFGPTALAALRDLAQLAGALLEARIEQDRWRLHAERVRVAGLSSSDWLWESDETGRVRWVSSGVEAHTGMPPSAVTGRTLAQINTPLDDDPTDSWRRYELARGELAPFRDVLAHRPSPTGQITVSISGTPVFDDGGSFQGYRGTTRNVTERVEAQRAARAAQRLLGDALDSLNAGVMISDPQGRVVMANPVWRNSLGVYMDDAASWPEVVRRIAEAGDYPDATDREAFVRWRLGIASLQGEQHEMRWKDRWVIVSDRLLPDGSVVHLSVDITDRKLAELALAEQQAQLRESQAQLSAVLGAVPDLWFVLDGEGRYLECSSDKHPLLVHPWESVRGKPFAAGVPAAVAERAVACVQRALASGRVQRFDYDLTTADGVARTFEARISPMPHQRVLYVTRDLTELRTLERDLLVMQRALEAEAALPICVADALQPDMPLIYVNPAFERLTGYSRAEALGRNCRFLQGDLREQPACTVLREALAAGRAASVTLDNVRKDGTVFTNALHVAPVRDSAGQLTHYIGVQRDVTEQSRAADKLRLSEDLYRSVAAAISDGLLVVTPTLGIIAINPAASEILGVEQTAAMNHGEAWPFELLDAHGQALAAESHPVFRVMRTDQPLMHQTHALRRPDGALRWLSVNAHPLQLRPEGRTFSVVLTFRDITRQRASEQALALAEERWQFAMEGSGDAVWDWDGKTDRFFYSPRWKEMRGYAEHEIGDHPDEWRTRTHPDDMPRVLSEIRRHLKGEVPFYDVEYRARHKQGHYLWIRDRGKAVAFDARGRAVRIVGTQSDITRSKQAEQALREKQAAELASRAKSEFLSRMSHEMRTPLNAVIGFTQLMTMSPDALDAASVREYAGHVLEAGQHLLALIDDVLDLQKIEEGALSLQLKAVDLREAVGRAAELLAPAAAGHEVQLVNEVPPGSWVHADTQRLRQVLLNVASNAIKYNHPGGRVRFRLEGPPGARVSLCVQDDGAGMSDEQMTRLFQPFERLGRETSAIEGTGLGLIIARSLTQAIGGRLSISSRAGHGTTVRLALQSADAPAGAAPQTPVTPPLPQPNGLRMLYVEDNRINAILFEEAMRIHGDRIELRVAEDGDQALSVAQAWQPEVLVLDAHLPGISGFEVLRQLRGLPGLDTVPAFMCSADAMPDDVQRAYEAGFVGYWTKPINVSAVLADVEQCLQRARGSA
ncbi:MAG: PAS domain S-box protein [Rhizobacter sp.]|nr:PAS domain S-box protein [Rhizobacter sp.]